MERGIYSTNTEIKEGPNTCVIGEPTRTMDIEKAEKTRMTFGAMDIEKRETPE